MRKNELLEEIQELTEENRKLRDMLADSDKMAHHARYEWQHEMVENELLRSINSDLLKNYEKLDGAVDKLRATVSVFLDTREDSSKETVDYEREIEAREEEIEVLYNKISNLERYSEGLRIENKELRNRVERYKIAVSKATVEKAKLEETIEKANKLLLKCVNNPTEQK